MQNDLFFWLNKITGKKEILIYWITAANYYLFLERFSAYSAKSKQIDRNVFMITGYKGLTLD